VDRILGLEGAVKTVYVGIKEPDTFIGENSGIERLERAGVRVALVEGLRDRILEVSTAGHGSRPSAA
jgi:pyrimidine deaminase RibD-like protein